MSQLTESPCKWGFDKRDQNVPVIESFLDKFKSNWWVGGLIINKGTRFSITFSTIFSMKLNNSLNLNNR